MNKKSKLRVDHRETKEIPRTFIQHAIPLHEWNHVRIKNGREVALGKAPIHSGWTTRSYTTTQKNIHKWLSTGLNVGFRIPETMLIIDIDPRHGATKKVQNRLAKLCGFKRISHLIEHTISTRTGGNGLHIYTKLPKGFNCRSLTEKHGDWPGIEFKKVGKQVVLPPSKHPNGNLYEWCGGRRVKQTPEALLTMLKRKVHGSSRVTVGEWPPAQLKDAFEYLPAPESRDDWFKLVAASYHATGGSSEALKLVIEWCRSNPNYDTDVYEEENRELWNDLKNREVENPATVGTLLSGMRKAGYRPNTPSAIEEFGDYFTEVEQITYNASNPVESLDKTIQVLEEHPFFSRANAIVIVEKGCIRTLDKFSVRNEVNRYIQFSKPLKDGIKPCDIHPELSERLRASAHCFRPLKAVITAPVVDSDGRIINQPGYDPETQLFLELSIPFRIDQSPTRKQVSKAIETLMQPFRDFPFSSPVDRGVQIAAMLSAWLRPVLPTCPAFGIDAPDQGTGKTLLAKCIAAIGGERTPIKAPLPSHDGAEVGKVILASLRDGKNVVVFDNQLGSFDSASLAAALTTPVYEGRLLGKSEMVKAPNATMFVFTGNNLSFKGDMARRVYTIRIDANTAEPTQRKFNFCPLEMVLDERNSIIEAMATLVLAQLNDADYKAKETTGSFEKWDKLVRQTVLWLSDRKFIKVDDPALAIRNSKSNDPTRRAESRVLHALHKTFGQKKFTSSEALENLRDVITESWPHVGEFNAHSLTTALKHRKDRIIDGRKLIDAGTNRDGTKQFRIRKSG